MPLHMPLHGKIRVLALVLATGLGAWSFGAAADVLDDASALIKAGQAEKALALLEPLQDKRAGQPAFDYLLGIAYVDSGQPARGVFALERVLDIDPKHVAARAELARAYFLLGENDAAKQEFEAAKKQQPPAGVQATIDKFLAAIDQRFVAERGGFTAFIEGRGGYDSNVNSATDSSTIPLAGGVPFTLSKSSRETDSGVFGLAGAARYTLPVRSDVNVFLGGDVDMKQNINSRFDTVTAGAETGFQYLKGRDQFRVALNGQLFYVQNPTAKTDINRRLLGGTVQWRRAVTGNDLFNAFGQVSEIGFPGQTARDIRNFTFGAGWTHGFSGRGRPVLFASGYGGLEDERNNAFPHFGRIFFGGRLGGQYTVRPKTTLYGSVLYQYSNYGATDPIFGERRQDDLLDFSLGVNYQLTRDWLITPQARFTRNGSTLRVNDFDRAQVYVAARRTFN